MLKKALAAFSVMFSVHAGLHDGIPLSQGSTYAHYAKNEVNFQNRHELPTLQQHYTAPVLKFQTGGVYASSVPHEEPYDHHPKYSYKYGVNDHHTGDHKSAEEERDGDVVRGSYSLLQPDGVSRTVKYTADHKNGFNPIVQYDGKARHPEPTYHESSGHSSSTLNQVHVPVHQIPVPSSPIFHSVPVQTHSSIPFHNTLQSAPIPSPAILQHMPIYTSTNSHIIPAQPVTAPQHTFVSNTAPIHVMPNVQNDLTFAASTAQQTPIRTVFGVQSLQNNVASTSPVTFAPAPESPRKQQSIRHPRKRL